MNKLTLHSDGATVIATKVKRSVDFEIIDDVTRYTSFYLTEKEIAQLIVFLQNSIKH